MALQLIKPQSPEDQEAQDRWEELGEAIDAAYPDFLERVKADAITPVVMAYESRLRAVELTLERLALMQVVQGQQVIIDLLGTLLKREAGK
jgi:hypothetical protein